LQGRLFPAAGTAVARPAQYACGGLDERRGSFGRDESGIVDYVTQAGECASISSPERLTRIRAPLL